MRISSSTIFTNAVSAMNAQENLIAKDQQQISSGKKVNTPQDDPYAAATAVTLNQQIARIDDFTNNRSLLMGNLRQLGSNLSSVTSTLQSVSTSLVQANTGTLSTQDKKTIASDLQSSLDTLIAYANLQDGNGNYIFGGYQTSTQPYEKGNFVSVASSGNNQGNSTLTPTVAALDAPLSGSATITINNYADGTPPTFTYSISGLPNAVDNVSNQPSSSFTDTTVQPNVTVPTIGLTSNGNSIGSLTLGGTPSNGDSFTISPKPTNYQGDTGARSVEVNDGQIVGTTLVGPQVFGSIPTGNGSFETVAPPTNTGSGIISSGSVTSSLALKGHQYALTFSGSSGQVNSGNQNTGSASYASGSATGTPSSNDQFNIVFSVSNGQTQYTIANQTTGQTQDPQSYTSGTPISLPNGAAFTLNGSPNSGDSFLYQPGPAKTYSVVDLSLSTTDNPQGTPVPGHTNVSFSSGNAIQFDGMSFNITGSPNTGDTFAVNPSSSTDVFTVIQNAINALNSYGGSSPANSSKLSNALSAAQLGITGAINQVDVGQAVVGGRQNEISSLDSSTALNKIDLQQELASLTSTDMASVISDLSQATVALTASQKAFVQVQGLNLFSYIQ
jgi:flagellar hook-associated protein 3 FlgL